MEETRQAGNYTIIESLQIGNIEVVLGENMNDENGLYYFVANCESNDVFERYVDVYLSNDYVEVAEIFAERISKEIERLKQVRADMSMNVITPFACTPVFDDSFVGEIIVIRPKGMSPEYRNEHYQIVRCTGGNGAKADGLGTSVFGKEMYSGDEVRYRRANVMGILKKEYYPAWLTDILECEKEMTNPNTFQYGGYHFLPVGILPKKPIYGISPHLSSDNDMKMWDKSYESLLGKANVEYSYKDFKQAAGDSKCDVFKCLENRKLYVPGGNELFQYKGDFTDVNKEKKKTPKEVER